MPGRIGTAVHGTAPDQTAPWSHHARAACPRATRPARCAGDAAAPRGHWAYRAARPARADAPGRRWRFTAPWPTEAARRLG